MSSMLKNTGSNGGNFVSLKKGYWGKRCEADDPGAVSRERGGQGDNAKDIVHEQRFDTLEGVIVNAYYEDSQFGMRFVLVLEMDGERVTAQMKGSGSVTESFIKCLPNIDVKKPVSLKAYVNKKDVGALFVTQDGDPVGWAYTRDEPNGMPEAKKKVVQGKTKWDFDEVQEFLYQKCKEWTEQFPGKGAEESDVATEEDLVF